ncbi:MAG: methylated-DNA--protein-cysteine methyltransferase, partial [Pseudomonadota bacterium]
MTARRIPRDVAPVRCIIELGIGPVRVVADDEAILACEPLSGDDAGLFPDATETSSEPHPRLNEAAAWLHGWQAGSSATLPPLTAAGTPFQREVWEALLRVPYGATCTYGDLARALHRPNAVRAVASAIGRNPVSIFVPCHRVVGADGALRGFRWGLDTKARLIAWEARVAVA